MQVPTPLEHRRLSLAVRAPRLAVVISDTATWADCLQLVEALTSLWGGATYCLIPTDGSAVQPLFWKLLKLHDPDWFAVYGTVQLSQELRERLLRGHSVTTGVGTHLGRLAPNYPLTRAEDAIVSSGARRVVSLTVEGPILEQVLIISAAGRVSPLLRKAAQNRHIEWDDQTLTIGESSGIYDLAQDIWAPYTSRHQEPWAFKLGKERLGLYTGRLEMRYFAPVLVVGTTLADFALYWTLRALRSWPWLTNVYWLPLVEKLAKSDIKASKKLWYWQRTAIQDTVRESYASDKLPRVTSASVQEDDLSRLAASIGLPNVVVSPHDFRQLVPYVARFWDTENTPNVNETIIEFRDGDALAIVDTPVLTGLDVGHETKLRWIVDASVEGLRLPTRPALTPLAVRVDDHASYRVSREGVAFTGLSHVVLHGTARRSLLVRPQLRLPTDNAVFASLCASVGLRVTPSDKGRYERELLRLLGGLQVAGQTLRTEATALVLDRLVFPTKPKPGVHDEGFNIAHVGYLDIPSAAKLVGNDEAKLILDAFLAAGLLRRGLIVKCQLCKARDWYPMREADDRVRCHRCSRDQVYSVDAPVAFRLDEMARLALGFRSDVSVLALDALRRRTRESFLFMTAADIWRETDPMDAKPWLELDFFASEDGALVLGEAKSGDGLGGRARQQLNKYVELSRCLQPERFVLATRADAWNAEAEGTLSELSRQLERLGIELVSLTHQDLWPRPLPQVVDATQS